jgi:hypothetical protein
MARKATTIYIVYEGENFLDIGTVTELSERLHISKKTIYYYMSPAHKKRVVNKKYSKKYKTVIKANDID